MDNAGDDSDVDELDEVGRDHRVGLQRPLHARHRPSGLYNQHTPVFFRKRTLKFGKPNFMYTFV